MSIRRKLVSLLLVIAVCVNFIPLAGIITPVQAGSVSGWQPGSAPVLNDALIQADASVIYDSQDHLYKMWYTQSHGLVDGFYPVFNLLLADAGPILTRIKSANYSDPINSTEAAAFKKMLQDMSTLPDDQLVALLQNFKPVIAYATSKDGIKWDLVSGNFSGSGPAAWDSFGVSSPSVIKNGDHDYEMWYTGWKPDLVPIKQLFSDLNSAIAPLDKIQLNPNETALQKVLSDLLIDKNIAEFINDINSYLTGSNFMQTMTNDLTSVMVGDKTRLGHAVSTDGVHWSPTGKLVFTDDDSTWDQCGAASPSVTKNGSTYEMWYTGTNVDLMPLTTLFHSNTPTVTEAENAIASAFQVTIGKATYDSVSGNWTRDTSDSNAFSGTNTVAPGTLHSLAAPSVIYNNGTYDMWYTDVQVNIHQMLSNFLKGDMVTAANSINSSIYHAVSSTDGTDWQGSTQVLAKGTWDNMGIGAPCVLQNGTNHTMWYTGFHADVGAIWNTALDTHSIPEGVIENNTQMVIERAYLGDPNAIVGIEVMPPSTMVTIDGQAQLIAVGTNLSGQKMPVTDTVTWNNDQPNIVSINGTGGVTGLAEGTAHISASRDGFTSLPVTVTVTPKVVPEITWNNPGPITYGTQLSSTQLNASANVTGTYVYTPPAGTVLDAGPHQPLHVEFTPSDTATYSYVFKDVYIDVLKASAAVNLTNLTQTYNGSPKSVTVTTDPAGLDAQITYNGSPTLPINIGDYSVVATIVDKNYQGSASGTLKILTPPIHHFTVTGFPGTTAPDVSHEFTVTAKDISGNTITGYTGSVTFGSTDTAATLPGAYTFVSGDQGVRIFAATLKTPGTQTITVADQIHTEAYGQVSSTVSEITPQTYTIHATAGDGGSITPSGDQTVNKGSDITFTVAAHTGYHVDTVTVDSNPATLNQDGTYTFQGVADNHTISATFAQNEYTLTINITGSGTVTKDPDQTTYHMGDTVTLNPTNNPGWTFAGFSQNVTNNKVIIGSNTTVTATFSQNEYTLTVTANATNAGTFTYDKEAPYHYGDVVQITAHPSDGYTFGSWSGDASGTANPVSVTIDGNKNVTANFKVILNIQVTLQGRTKGTASYIEPVEVWLHASDSTWTDDSLIPNHGALYYFSTTTNDQGLITLQVNPGDYIIRVKGLATLRNKTTGAINVNQTITINIGTLIEGDINGDNKISILDLSSTISCYGYQVGDPLAPPNTTKCDINKDLKVSILDLSLMISNYGLLGAQ